MGNVSIVDKARVNVGVTMGEWTVKDYVKNINDNTLQQVITNKIREIEE